MWWEARVGSCRAPEACVVLVEEALGAAQSQEPAADGGYQPLQLLESLRIAAAVPSKAKLGQGGGEDKGEKRVRGQCRSNEEATGRCWSRAGQDVVAVR